MAASKKPASRGDKMIARGTKGGGTQGKTDVSRGKALNRVDSRRKK